MANKEVCPSSKTGPRFFYGWWIVGAGFVVWLLSGGFIILGFTAFFEPITNEFGWSYVQVSVAAALRGVEVGLIAPFVGLIVDRWGPRKLMFGGFIICGFRNSANYHWFEHSGTDCHQHECKKKGVKRFELAEQKVSRRQDEKRP